MKLAGSVAAAAELLTLGLGGNGEPGEETSLGGVSSSSLPRPSEGWADGSTVTSIMPSASGIPLSHEPWNATRTQPRRQLQQHAVAGGLHDPPPWLATIGSTAARRCFPGAAVGTDRGGQAMRAAGEGDGLGERKGQVGAGLSRHECFAVYQSVGQSRTGGILRRQAS